MIRRYGEAVEPGRRYIPRPGAYAVIAEGGTILATHQMEPNPEFQLPGGGIDPGEAPVEALHREVMEETGWRIRISRRLGAYRRFTYMPEYDLWAEKLCQIYLARPVRKIGSPTEAGHTALWLPMDTAATVLESAGDRAFVARYAGLGQRVPCR